MKKPCFAFFPGDWRSDGALHACSLDARGFWIELLCLMHDSPRYGYLLKANGKPWTIAEVAKAIGVHHHACYKALTTLETMGVTSRSPEGYLYSRRMVRDHVKRDKWLKDQQNNRPRQPPLSGDCQAAPNPIPTPREPLDQLSKYIDSSCSKGGYGGESAYADTQLSASEVAAREPKLAARAANRQRRWPENFLLSEELRSYAVEHGMPAGEVESQFEHFENHHKAKGSKFVSWERAWYTWVGNYKQFARGARHGESSTERRRREADEQTARVVAMLQAKRAH